MKDGAVALNGEGVKAIGGALTASVTFFIRANDIEPREGRTYMDFKAGFKWRIENTSHRNSSTL